MASFLKIKDEPRLVDLIVVATPFRPRFLYAFDLLKKGYANRILLLGDARIKMVWSGKTSLELAKREALKNGVPNSKIYTQHSTGTRGDAYAAEALMSLLGLKSAMIISDPLNMRRLSMIFKHIFARSDFDLTYIPINQRKGHFGYWWQSSYSFVYVIKEWIKLPINFFLLLADSSKIEENQKYYDLKSFESIPREFLEEIQDQSLAPTERPHGSMIKKLIQKTISQIGEFLVFNHEENRMDVAITSKISKKVLLCYKKGSCEKIFLFIGASSYTLANNSSNHFQVQTKQTVEKMGIKANDLVLVPYSFGEAHSFPAFLAKFFDEHSLNKAKVFFPYYETRKFKFYFDRLLDSRFEISVHPLEISYQNYFKIWHKNTGLANIFLDQYLLMMHYYFNKFFWSTPH